MTGQCTALFCGFRENSKRYSAEAVIYYWNISKYNLTITNNSASQRAVVYVTVRGRLIAIKLLELQEKNPEYLKQLGVHVTMNKVESTDDERRK